jgi:hypothetical protein
VKGNVAGDKEISQGGLRGHEYEISGQPMARLRLFSDGGRVYYATVFGSTDQIQSPDAGTFLDSYQPVVSTAKAKAAAGEGQ